MSKEGKSATGAVRKEDGAKAPDSPADEIPGGAAVTEADKAPIVETEADKKAKKAANDKASKIKREKEAAAKKVAEEEAEAKRGHFIAEGKCISCKKGILSAGDRVKPEYFGTDKDGEEVLNRLVESGAVKEVK